MDILPSISQVGERTTASSRISCPSALALSVRFSEHSSHTQVVMPALVQVGEEDSLPTLCQACPIAESVIWSSLRPQIRHSSR